MAPAGVIRPICAPSLGEPHVAVRAGRDPLGAGGGHGVFGDGAGRGDPPDRVPAEVSVNHRLPSGPAAMPPVGRRWSPGTGNSVMVPAGVIRPIAVPADLGEPHVAVRAGRDALGPLSGAGYQ